MHLCAVMKNNEHFRKDLSITESMIYRLEPDYVFKLMKLYPGLTEDEIKICVLMKNKFSVEETAKYMSISDDEISVVLNNLNKKLKKYYNKELKNIL
jgi:hypothetical protein